MLRSGRSVTVPAHTWDYGGAVEDRPQLSRTCARWLFSPAFAEDAESCKAMKAWASQTLPTGAALTAVLKLCARAPEFVKAYALPMAHRTSNMLDCLMDHMDRRLYAARYFHGHLMSAEYAVRADALLSNFLPYYPRAAVAKQFASPAHKLNGFVYHANWLHNLLISASMGGYRQ